MTIPPYTPIPCALYDRFEAAATLKQRLKLGLIQDDGQEVAIRGLPLQFNTQNGVEFGLFEDEHHLRHWIRLDRVKLLD
ncbi:MAG: hypothetical protein COX57_03835 [Alphaproteobacteria bacterium CG_4_10_14_0_2_um_filter_63_37]|nr:MAG: hypothetical protein AUJ55_08375 [Proteobacteria bacterium CG1_02_64_396]PJA25338.1 MAG: hypothetical protein COX57_03835 [Alphaproteobacteria bacterium CG_4_10_14_0_2_um_filter_63_37]